MVSAGFSAALIVRLRRGGSLVRLFLHLQRSLIAGGVDGAD
jgi:hypothetical protein